ncbi:MAG: hypothetical protein FWD71_15505 [Oscillospiraceae bacterium]|nr:hypothetical protein [Oscillospiraceae bacterium]
MYLYHYFDKTIGPFVNLSDVSVDEAKAILNKIKEIKPDTQSAQRHPEYVKYRHHYEEILRTEFAKKGGVIKRQAPHYMVVEHSPWLSTWFENCAYIKIPVEEFDIKTVSFTYGDSHPVFSNRAHKMDDKEYRRKLYTYYEILEIIEKYGLPQDWNDDGRYGPERYVEAHIWSDETINKYR